MRRIPRKTLVAVLAAVAVLGLTSLALADGASDNVSQGESGVNSNQQKTTPGNASLFTEVTTLDENNNPFIPDQAAEEVYIDYDDSIVINSTGLAQCDPADLAGTTTQQAYNACGPARVGSGNALARIPGVPDPVQIELTVSDFNGEKSLATGCPVGNKNTILLHARNDALGQTVVVSGEILQSTDPGGMDGGRMLSVCDAPDTAGDLGALVLFNSQVSRTYKDGAVNKSYIKAKCDDANKVWNFHYRWVYDDASTDTDTSSQNCATP